ncbi:MAG: helix-turn-helix transcriptional regulator [Bacteroidota bacterium]
MGEPEFLQLGLKIKKLRTAKKLTQNQFANLCEFEKASMSRIESGRTNLTLRSLYKISNALDVHITVLFSE